MIDKDVMIHMAQHGRWRRAGFYGLDRKQFVDWAKMKGYTGIFCYGPGGRMSDEGEKAFATFLSKHGIT